MKRHFKVEQYEQFIKIQDVSPLDLRAYSVYENGQLVASFYTGKTFYVPNLFSRKQTNLTVWAVDYSVGVPHTIGEQYVVSPYDRNNWNRERDFQPGDILVASDNLNESLTGYVGHSALVVDESHVIESPGGHPAIQKDSIQQFLEKHPVHAQFRPRSAELGKKAVGYAEQYLKEYEENLENDVNEPEFSFMSSQSLEEPWKYIYCSKLIWLSYYKGGDYKLENDYLWYSPEDLYTGLQKNDDFKMVYKHDDVKFHLDT